MYYKNASANDRRPRKGNRHLLTAMGLLQVSNIKLASRPKSFSPTNTIIHGHANAHTIQHRPGIGGLSYLLPRPFPTNSQKKNCELGKKVTKRGDEGEKV